VWTQNVLPEDEVHAAKKLKVESRKQKLTNQKLKRAHAES
jgi:hypothetical protein